MDSQIPAVQYTLIVQDIFQHMNVRRQSIRAEMELTLIQELLEETALLNHKINFRLVNGSNNRELCRIEAKSSVLEGVLMRFGEEAVPDTSAIKWVSYDVGEVRVEGIMSLPIPSACGSRGCINIYVNGKWVRGGGLVGEVVKKMYAICLHPVSSSGPSPRHSTTRPALPVCVLRVTCPHSSYPLPQPLIHCIHMMLIHTLCPSSPAASVIPSIDELFVALKQGGMGDDSAMVKECYQKGCPPSSSGNDHILVLPVSGLEDKKRVFEGSEELEVFSSSRDCDVLFEEAFLSQAALNHEKLSGCPISRVESTDLNLTSERVIDVSRVTERVIEVRSSRYIPVNCDQAAWNEDSDIFERVHHKSVNSVELDEDFGPCEDVVPVTSFQTAPLSLSKESLFSELVPLAQVDDKYILAVADGLVISVDQHAADERVRLESARKLLNLDRETGRLIKSSRRINALVPITDSTVYRTLVSDWCHDVCTEWGFSYSIRPSESRTSRTNFVLYNTPVIENEVLTVSDFIEFVRYIGDQRCLPRSALEPPAVSRILASSACRHAIKFGDILSPQECADLLKSLSKTHMPFQCAHGRPSIVPLVKFCRDGVRKDMNERKPMYYTIARER
mmetsp:Transcript_25367/g.37412  ORF Transcript_25367/g.37412 Transcript_25367/m.37412 type:complete len:618 (-) Transcript_25367:37-1890(-)